MKIAMLTPHFAPHVGGIETHVDRIGRSLSARGHDVHVITHDFGDSSAVDDGPLTVHRVRSLSPSAGVPVGPGLVRELRRHKWDVVHVHNYHSLAFGQSLRRGSGALIATPHFHGVGHSAWASVAHVPWKVIGGRVFKEADAVVAVSSSEAEKLRASFPVVTDKLSVIHNGVELPTIASRVPESKGRRVLVVGRLALHKQVERVIRAVALMPDDVALDVVGDGPMRPKLEALVSDLQIKHRATFHGRVDAHRLADFHATSWLFVTLSEQEAFGLTLAEALAHGSAAAASGIPAHRDVVELAQRPDVVFVPANSSHANTALLLIDAMAVPGSRPRATLPTWDDAALELEALYATAVRRSDDV